MFVVRCPTFVDLGTFPNPMNASKADHSKSEQRSARGEQRNGNTKRVTIEVEVCGVCPQFGTA